MVEEEQIRHEQEYYAFKENLQNPFEYIKQKLKEVVSFSELESKVDELSLKLDDPEVMLNIKICSKNNNILIILKLESDEDINEALPTFVSTLKGAFSFFQLIYDSRQRKININFYEEIHDIENEIRKNIMKESILLYGKEWFKNITANSSSKDLRFVKKEAEKTYKNDLKDIHLQPIIYPHLYYFSLRGLKFLIEENNNWLAIFADVYGKKDNLTFINKICDMRNKIMHNQYLSDKSKERLGQYIEDIRSIISKSNP